MLVHDAFVTTLAQKSAAGFCTSTAVCHCSAVCHAEAGRGSQGGIMDGEEGSG